MPGPDKLNEAYQAIRGLRAIRQFSERPISDPDLHALLEAGRWTGSSKNRQNWSVVVVTDPAVKEALAACGAFTDPLRRAPLAIALVQEETGYEFDVGRLAQNLMLAAKALGLATCPVTFHRDGDVKPILGLPEPARCRYGIAVGYPSEESGPTRMGGRKELGEFVHWNRY